MVAGRVSGDRLASGRTGVVPVLRGAGVLPVAVGPLRRRSASVDHAGLIAEALGAIGGVPARVLADRMACLKGGVVANVVVPTPDYVHLSGHYGFAPDFCHANAPRSKGIVENS